ncbi:hypothetical protein KP509_19G075700 [Ceratopteris richardii]|uniref:Uncharacterized protein n=1 Tax=Ceratopteris richardii TaxID=49495 RepID=A0A8T2SQ91_CERRI|nr:hypothetical protein KP509_19G075700 [Ceratopteris richardii]
MGELEKENARLKGELARWMSEREKERRKCVEKDEKVDRMDKELQTMLNNLSALGGEIEKTNTLGAIVKALIGQLEKSFQDVNRRIGGVESRGDELEKKLENLEGRRCEELGLVEKLDEIERKHKDGAKELERKHVMLQEKIERLYDLFGKIENVLQENEKRMHELEPENVKLQKQMMCVDCKIAQHRNDTDLNTRGLRELATKVDELRNIFTDSAQDLTKRLVWVEDIYKNQQITWNLYKDGFGDKKGND